MPELPEVETIARRLQTILPGLTVKKVTVYRTKSFQGKVEEIIGHTITTVSRKGKQLRIQLSGKVSLAIHLKMTGQLILIGKDGQRVGGGHPTADWTRLLPSSHTRVEIEFTSGQQLFFNDQRVFGWIKVLPDEVLDQEWAQMAPDIIDEAITTEYLFKQFQRRRQPIKVVLLDTSISQGLGNIYVCDALYLAKISPFRPANSLSKKEVETVLKTARQVIHQGIELGGTTTDGMYVNVEGFAGRYQEVMRVYKKSGQACIVCGHAIEKKQLGGRGTYFCAICQI